MAEEPKVRLNMDDINVIIKALKYNTRSVLTMLENDITYSPEHTRQMENKVAQLAVTRAKLRRFKELHGQASHSHLDKPKADIR